MVTQKTHTGLFRDWNLRPLKNKDGKKSSHTWYELADFFIYSSDDVCPDVRIISWF